MADPEPETAVQDLRSYHEDSGAEQDTRSNSRANGSPSRSSLNVVVWLMKALLFISVTGCLVLSKLTIIKLLANLHSRIGIFPNDSSVSESQPHSLQRVVNLYWQILLIMVVPTFLTWINSVFGGLLASSSNHPWPKKSAIIFGGINAAVEAVSECLLVFVVFVSLPPEIVIFLMSGLFSVQGVFFVFSLLCRPYRRNSYNRYEPLEEITNQLQANKANRGFLVIVAFTGVVLQITGVGSLTGFVIKAAKMEKQQRLLGFLIPTCLLMLSVTWTNTIQKLTYKPSEADLNKAERLRERNPGLKKISVRWKANFISTTVRLIVYPIVSYIIVRFLYQLKDEDTSSDTPVYDVVTIDPWCIPYITELKVNEAFSWISHDSAVFAVHIIASFIAYSLQRVACYMTLHFFGLALPVFLASPISIGVYFVSVQTEFINLHFFPFATSDQEQLSWSNTMDSQWYVWAFGSIIVVWIGQIMVTGYNLVKSQNAILSSDEDMFVRPYYNSVFLEQYLAINRCVSQSPNCGLQGTRKPCRVFICSTMYRENTTEMKQLLRSLYRVAQYYKEQRDQHDAHDTFESHIFFDGGCNGIELSQFATQLMSLVHDAMKVDLVNGRKQQTPYGCRFTWEINSCMPFVIHLKDNQKIKNKKRWSQVMYMNYIINYRAGKENMDLEHTFILTTDADIDFKAEATVTLLDMLARDPQVGAVCARTHPRGSGILYWYQLFDYAVGHWLQKGAEHILGSVLCCPGCFSMFRCSALKDCLQTYSGEVSNAMEFLMKDMGEDRWLCTLLIEKGWRLEYCAISKNYTYCPVEFDEFFKQRRRWIPSTIANLWLLVSKGRKITAKNESVGWLFVIYQFLIIVSTIIAPATVILVISSGLQTAFSVSSIAVILIFILVSVVYGLICLYASQKTQLDTAKLLTFVFSVVMATVVVGIVKDIVEDIVQTLEKDTAEGSGNNPHGRFTFPVGETTVYVPMFAIIFILTAALHNKEFLTLFQCLWYLLGLPSGYLLLLIYSTANLNSRSWGTREISDNSQTIHSEIWKIMKDLFFACMVKTGIKSGKGETNKSEETKGDTDDEPKVKEKTFGGALEETQLEGERHQYDWLRRWLRKCDCEKFYECFVNEGYTEEFYVAEMSLQDLKSIGVQPEGYARHLQKAIKKLCSTPVQFGIPKDVHSWIIDLHMEAEEDDYVRKFRNAGYFGKDDVENLPLISKEELIKDIGVTKKAHIKRFLQGIGNFGKVSSPDQKRMVEAQLALQLTNDQPSTPLDDHDELTFWHEKLDNVLHPVPESLTYAGNLKDELKSLRNSVLIAALLINLIWIILLHVLTIDKLLDIGFNRKILSLLFLAVYSFILVVQFLAMLLHRTVTIAHYIGRLSQSLPVEQTNELTETLSGVL